MPYTFFAFLAAIFFATSSLTNKFASKHTIRNKNSLLAYFMFASFLFFLPLLPFVPKTIPSIDTFKTLFIAELTFIIGYYLFYAGIFTIDASSFAPLFQLQSLIIAVLAYLFLGERFPLQNYLWGIVIITGAILVTLEENISLRSFFKRGALLIIATQFLHAFSNLYIGFTLKSINYLQVSFWATIIIGILLIPFILITKPKLNYSFKYFLPVLIASTTGSLGALSMFKAFTENLTITSLISLLSAPIVFVTTIIASKFSPKLLEHHSAKVYIIRGIGLLITLFGVYQIITS